MRTHLLRHTIVVASLVALSAPAARGQGIFVTDFHGSGATFTALGSTAQLHRGTTSSVQIVKDLIDLVPLDQIKTTTAGITLTSITNGKTSGKGFIRFSIIVRGDQAPGSTVTVDVGLLDHFKFNVVRKGELTAVTFAPDPATVAPGTPITITGTGNDFGTPALTPIRCHTFAMGAHNATSFTGIATRSATCDSNAQYAFFINGSGTNDAPRYTTSAGVAGFAIASYRVPPTTAPCQSAPGITTPLVALPSNGQRFEFVQGSVSPQSLTLRWNNATANGVVAPNNEFIVVLKRTDVVAIIPSPRGDIDGGITSKDSSLVVGTQVTKKFLLPGAYSMSIRARNCGDFGPITTVGFQLTFRP